MNRWIDKDTEIYCSFAEMAGNTGCQMMNTAFHYYGLNKIYKSFSVNSIRDAVASVLTLNIKGFAITLSIGILCSMFTAIFVTKTFYMIILRGGDKKISI